MGQHYASFLIRWWLPESGDPRIKVEHIQSGASAVAPTLRAAIEWMDARMQVEDAPRPHAERAEGELA